MNDETRSKQRNKYSNVNIDTSLLENLASLLASSTSDITPLHEFLSNENNQKQIITIWSYYNTVNDHPNFTSATIKLIKLSQLSTNDVLQPLILPLIKDILNNHVKVIYRGLSNMKPSITNPILNLMSEIVKFRNGSVIDDLITNFDLNLSILPKLLSTPNYRHNFIEFWLLLLQNAKYLTRKDILSNYKKVNNGFYKFLQDDSVNLTKKIISTLDAIILMEPHYNKQLKCKILSEFNLSKFVSLFADAKDESLKQQLYDFIIKIATNDKFGLNFHDDKIWFHNTNGVAVQHSTFKIYNKLIFNMILNLKPFEDDSQLKMILEIFAKIPELIPPYTQYLYQIHGSNDPKLTSFWIGQTLLLEELIRLPIPTRLQYLVEANQVDSGNEMSMDLIVENLIPSPLTKSCLVKSLQCESLLIRQISAQVLLFSFAKLESILEFLDSSNQLDLKFKLTNYLIKTRLPDLSIVINSLNESHTKNPEKKLLILTLTMIIKNYLLNFPTLSANIPNDIYLNLIKDDLSGVELITLDSYLDLQGNIDDTNSIISKWWNAGNNDKNSFFTKLIKLSLSNTNLYNKVFKILMKLMEQTIILDKNVLCSQVFAILQSFRSDLNLSVEELNKIWKFWDEVISRCVRSPYKYLDKAREVSSLSSSHLSPLIITIFEQWKFVDTTQDSNNWFCLLMRYMILAGESEISIKFLFESNGLSWNEYLQFNNYEENFISNKSVNKLIFNSESSFFEFVLTSPLQVLDKRIPVNQQDFVGLIRRLEFIINDSSLPLAETENVLILLMEKLGNYISTVPSFEFKMIFWKSIFITDDSANEKLNFVSRILNEIFKQIDFKSDEYNTLIVFLLRENKFESITSEACWCLTDDQLFSFIDIESESVRISILNEILIRNLKINNNEIINWTSSARQELQLIHQLVDNNLVEVNDAILTALIKENNKETYPIIKSCFTKLEDYDLSTIKDKELLVFVGSIADTSKYKDFLVKLINETVDDFYSNFQLEYLNLLVNVMEFLSVDQMIEILSNILSNDVVIKDANNIFSLELLSLLLNFKDIQNESFVTELLSPWLLKCLLYINQNISETDELDSNFLSFLGKIGQFFSKVKVWKFGAVILNTQLEIILNSKFVNNSNILKYAHLLISNSSFKIEYNKSLQIFINNENNSLYKNSQDLRFYSTLVIHDLFYKNINVNSNQTLQFNLLQFYHGTKRVDDLILKKILIDIELSISFNLVNHFTSWEFVENFDEPFIKKENNSLTISMNKTLVQRSIKNFVLEDLTLPEDLESFYHHNKVIENFTYDDEFLMLLIINNDELFIFNGDDFKIDLKKLIDSNLLQFIVMNLSNENSSVVKISQKILSSIFNKLEEGKNKNLFKVYIGNLLSFDGQCPSIVILFYANLIPILNNPNHHLFEKLARYLLSSSRLSPVEIPLFQSISQPVGGNELDSYYKQVTWFLENLLSNLKNLKDLKVLSKDKIIEWILNFNNNKYINLNLKNLVLSIILKIIKIGGSNLLIKSYSLLSWLESIKEIEISTSNELINKQFKLNYEKIALTLKLLIDNDQDQQNKRKLQDWFDDDLNNHVKRVCK